MFEVTFFQNNKELVVIGHVFANQDSILLLNDFGRLEIMKDDIVKTCVAKRKKYQHRNHRLFNQNDRERLECDFESAEKTIGW